MTERLQTLLDQLAESDGHQVVKDWTEIQWTLTILQGHLEELNGSIASMITAMGGGRSNIKQREAAVIRCFQGYLSCAYTLYEQEQRVRGDHLCERGGLEDQCTCRLCQRTVERLREHDVLPQWTFIQRLRAYFQHIRTPSVVYLSDEAPPGGGDDLLLNIDRDDRSIQLNKTVFSAFLDDHREAQEYVDSQEDIRLQEELNRFHTRLDHFYGWYLDNLKAENQELVTEHEDLVRDIRSEIQDSEAT